MIHRARYGFGSGDHSTTFNFFRQLKSEIDRHTPEVVYMVDEGRPVQSLALDPSYKGNRKKDLDESFKRQRKEIFEICKTILGVKYAHHPLFECDDVIAHLATSVHKDDYVTIVSTDTDFIQLLEERENIEIWNPVKKQYVEKISNYVIFKSLKGDQSDNIVGIPGVGATRAMSMASDSSAMKSFFDSHPEYEEIFLKAHAMIKFKPVKEEEVCYIDSKFDEEKLFQEFSAREFKSMTGNSWHKWVKTFGGLNGV
jgi:5'-3' exonuclease